MQFFFRFFSLIGCYKLSSVYLPEVTTIGSSGFNTCSSLSAIYLPKVTSIGNGGFTYCDGLSVVSMPVIGHIGNSAFRYCSALEKVYVLTSSVPTLGASTVFSNTPMSLSSYIGYFGSIFVRSSLYDAFVSATYWSIYSARIVSLTDTEIEALG